jgi:thioredoxin 1
MSLKGQITDNGVTLVKFSAGWCGPCKMMTPVVEKLEQEDDNLTVVSVDIDEDIDLAEENEVTSVPTMMFYRDGEYQGRYVGAMPEPLLRKIISGEQTLAR